MRRQGVTKTLFVEKVSNSCSLEACVSQCQRVQVPKKEDFAKSHAKTIPDSSPAYARDLRASLHTMIYPYCHVPPTCGKGINDT